MAPAAAELVLVLVLVCTAASDDSGGEGEFKEGSGGNVREKKYHRGFSA